MIFVYSTFSCIHDALFSCIHNAWFSCIQQKIKNTPYCYRPRHKGTDTQHRIVTEQDTNTQQHFVCYRQRHRHITKHCYNQSLGDRHKSCLSGSWSDIRLECVDAICGWMNEENVLDERVVLCVCVLVNAYILCIYLYIDICMWIYVCIYINVYINICIRMYIYTYMCICVYIYIHIDMNIYEYMWICIWQKTLRGDREIFEFLELSWNSWAFLNRIHEDTFRCWHSAYEKGSSRHSDASDEANADRWRCVY